jgi:hypothetical protein
MVMGIITPYDLLYLLTSFFYISILNKILHGIAQRPRAMFIQTLISGICVFCSYVAPLFEFRYIFGVYREERGTSSTEESKS